MGTAAHHTIWFVMGTRPEMIKLAPVIVEAKSKFDIAVIATGQHPGLRDIADDFGIALRTNLGVQAYNLDDMIRKILAGLEFEAATKGELPDCLIVQGDTTSAMAAALWGFNNKVPVAHVEAGLRTHSLGNPYPEEGNRRIISSVATYHYAPTPSAYKTLLTERASDLANIKMTGNTVIDTLKMAPDDGEGWEHPTVLVTLHRRESWGGPMIETLKGLLDWLDETDMQAVWPVHPGTVVQGVASSFDHPKLVKEEAMDYREFIQSMRSARFLLTDSGGVQEEGAALGKYTIVVRHATERPEAVIARTATLVPPTRIEVKNALLEAERGWMHVEPSNVFGDGNAAKYIVEHLSQRLGKYPSQSGNVQDSLERG